MLSGINNVVRSTLNLIRSNTPSTQQLARNIHRIALPAIGIAALASIPTASAGLFSGLITLGGCIGAGVVFPASIFWAAAPCYELTMVATINPLLP